MNPNRWRALAVLGLFQFMLILDISVVNVALPSIQDDLDFTTANLAWVVNGYVLMAAGFLLLGGRLADVFGRRRMFLLGVAVFAIASIVSGAAFTPEMLVAGRFAQGLGEALAAPAALGLIVLLFQDPAERVKALGVWGGLSGLGGVTGTVISGVLVDFASWPWIFFINVPVAVIAALLVPILIKESRMTRSTTTLNFGGTLVGTVGLIAIVFGLLQVASSQWGSVEVLVPLSVGLLLVAVMVFIESRSANPLIPWRFFADRVRILTYVALLANAAAFLSYVFLLSLFEQTVLEYSPLQAGLSFVPLGLGIGAGLAVATALMPRLGYRVLLPVGLLGIGVGLLLSSGITEHSSYVGGILPGMIVVALFSGVFMPAATNAAFHRIDQDDSSLASAVQGVMGQIGGALGLAGLVALALSYAQQLELDPATAATSGYAFAFHVGAVLLGVVGLVCLVALPRTQHALVSKDEPVTAV
jgi:EmrB/QacA subfamily drug resistance transporter